MLKILDIEMVFSLVLPRAAFGLLKFNNHTKHNTTLQNLNTLVHKGHKLKA